MALDLRTDPRRPEASGVAPSRCPVEEMASRPDEVLDAGAMGLTTVESERSCDVLAPLAGTLRAEQHAKHAGGYRTSLSSRPRTSGSHRCRPGPRPRQALDLVNRAVSNRGSRELHTRQLAR
jgi:hypothetical protein